MTSIDKRAITRDTGNRLKQVRQELGFSQKDFAEKLGINQTQLSATELGKINVTARTMIILRNDFNVNMNWYIGGNGKMFIEGDHEIHMRDIILRLQEYEKQIEADKG